MATDVEMKAKLILELQDEVSKSLKKMADNAQDAAGKTESRWKKSLKEIQGGWKLSAQRIQQGQQKMAAGMRNFGKAAIVASPFVLMAKQAAEFDESMREVATLTDMNVKDFRKTFDSVVESTQIAFGKSSQDVVKAFYDGISAGVDPTVKDVDTFLKSIGKLAIAGKADLTVAGDAMTSVVNAYGKGAISMQRVSEILFAGVREGKTTLPELAASIGQVAPVAAALGVSFEELTASIATVTAGGLSTAEAATQVKAGMTTMIKFSSQAEKEIAKLGLTVNAATVKEDGMFNTIMKIDKAIKKNVKGLGAQRKAFGTIFNNVRALQPAMALAGAQNDKFKETLDATTNSAGNVDEAFLKMNGDMLKFRQMQQQAAISTKKLGDAALPIFTRLADAMIPMLENLNEFIDTDKEAVNNILKLGGAIVGLQVGIGVFNMLSGAVLMFTSPLGLAIVAVGTLGFAINALSDETTDAGRTFATTFSSMDGFLVGLARHGLFVIDVFRTMAKTISFGLSEKIMNFTGMAQALDKLNVEALKAEDRIAKREKIVEKGNGSFVDQFMGFSSRMGENVVKQIQPKQQAAPPALNINMPVTVQGGVENPAQVGQDLGRSAMKAIAEAQMKMIRKKKLAEVL